MRMKLFDVRDLAFQGSGEYVLGSEALDTHACYLMFGIMNPGEQGRLIKPGRGHEEIVCLVQGEIIVHNGSGDFQVKAGQAFHLRGDDAFYMDNSSDEIAVYVIAGGHSEPHAH
jgi:uncharacterized cupin superfamily protein